MEGVFRMFCVFVGFCCCNLFRYNLIATPMWCAFKYVQDVTLLLKVTIPLGSYASHIKIF